MHLVPAPGWDAPGTRLPSTDIHQRGEPRLTGKLHLLTCSKAESRWGKGVLQLHVKDEAGRPQRHCGVLTRKGTGLCPRCFGKDHGSRGLECGTKPVSLKHQTGRGKLLWAMEFLLAPKDCSLSQQKGMSHQKGSYCCCSWCFSPERPGQELGVWLSG